MVYFYTTPTEVAYAAGVNTHTPTHPHPRYTMNNQHLQYEFSPRITFPINTLAKNVLTPQLYADLRRLIDFGNSVDRVGLTEFFRGPPQNLDGDELTHAVNSKLAGLSDILHERFNNMMFSMTIHSANARREYTDMGSHGMRLNLMQSRLEQDEGSLFRLMSSNEDIDITRVLMLMSSAEAVYMSALRVGSNIINVTLANFIQF
jgi:flagellin-like hook-associated protein FlgL